VALVVCQQLPARRGLRLLQGRSAVQRVLGGLEGSLVDRVRGQLLRSSGPEGAFWLRGAVLELRGHHSASRGWLGQTACAYAGAHADAHVDAHIRPDVDSSTHLGAHLGAYFGAHCAAEPNTDSRAGAGARARAHHHHDLHAHGWRWYVPRRAVQPRQPVPIQVGLVRLRGSVVQRPIDLEGGRLWVAAFHHCPYPRAHATGHRWHLHRRPVHSRRPLSIQVGPLWLRDAVVQRPVDLEG